MPIQSPLYTLEVVNNRDVIKITGTALIITVYALKYESFIASEHKIVIYGDDHGDPLAFVVDGWNDDTSDDHLELVSVAIMWYAKYLGYPEMQLQLGDSPPQYNLLN